MSDAARVHALAAIEVLAAGATERKSAKRGLEVLKAALTISAEGDDAEKERRRQLTEPQFFTRHVSKLGLQPQLQRVEQPVFNAAMHHLLLCYRELLMDLHRTSDADERGGSRGCSISLREGPLDSVPKRYV